MRFDFRHGRDLIRLFSGPARKPVMAGDRRRRLGQKAP
jgi:hypothetical protein